MDLHQRQQFDFLLGTATERFVERLEQRHRGSESALQILRDAPDGEGVWTDQFVDAIFQDFLLDNVEGSAFVLQSIPKRKVDAPPTDTVERMLIHLAKAGFYDLLLKKTIEALEQHSGYQPVQFGEHA